MISDVLHESIQEIDRYLGWPKTYRDENGQPCRDVVHVRNEMYRLLLDLDYPDGLLDDKGKEWKRQVLASLLDENGNDVWHSSVFEEEERELESGPSSESAGTELELANFFEDQAARIRARLEDEQFYRDQPDEPVETYEEELERMQQQVRNAGMEDASPEILRVLSRLERNTELYQYVMAMCGPRRHRSLEEE